VITINVICDLIVIVRGAGEAVKGTEGQPGALTLTGTATSRPPRLRHRAAARADASILGFLAAP
jgi:hypothetical protein